LTAPYTARVVSGHFERTWVTFKVYLPPQKSWEGRFIQNVYPVGDGNATPEDVKFSFASGGYVVQTGGAAGNSTSFCELPCFMTIDLLPSMYAAQPYQPTDPPIENPHATP
jgi:hypothetical protein